jgi:hypothetical protein
MGPYRKLSLALGTSNSSFHGKDVNNGCFFGRCFIGAMLYYDLMNGMMSYESNVLRFHKSKSLGPPGVEKSKNHRKCIKRKHKIVNLHLGENIQLHEILEMEDLAIVGHFLVRRMGGDIVKASTKENIETVIAYTSKSLVLVKGWMVWIFRFMVEANKIL